MHKTKRLFATLAVAAIVVPTLALAQSTDLQSQIQALVQQIQTLQQQLKTLVASSASSTKPFLSGIVAPGQIGKMVCVTLNRNLGPGSQGDDVKNLQQMLGSDPENEFHGTPTGFFGPLTAQAMMKFQMRMGIASSTTGSVGPLTRGFFERRCGKGEGMGGEMQGPVMGGAITGQITANSGSSITIQNKDGKSIVANVSASTTIEIMTSTSTPPTSGTISSLTVGMYAGVEGPKNTDGSIDAIHIKASTIPPPTPPMMGGKGEGEGPKGMMPMIGAPIPYGGEGPNRY